MHAKAGSVFLRWAEFGLRIGRLDFVEIRRTLLRLLRVGRVEEWRHTPWVRSIGSSPFPLGWGKSQKPLSLGRIRGENETDVRIPEHACPGGRA